MPYDVITFIRKTGVVITIYAFSSLAFLDQSAIDNTGHSYPQNKSTAEKMKFSIADLVRFTEEICNEKLHFLCSDVISDNGILPFVCDMVATKQNYKFFKLKRNQCCCFEFNLS